MEATINRIFLDHRKNWMYDNPVKVTMEFDYDSPPVGSALLFIEEDGLYANIILDQMRDNQLELYPHISFSKAGKAISSIKLSSIEHVDERVRTIDQQTEDINLPGF
jgi:hypothetical protein